MQYTKWTMLMAAAALSFGSCGDSDSGSTGQDAASAIQATPVPIEQSLTTIAWNETSKNLGKVTEGQQIEVVFKFVNSGSKPLIIQNVSASCGCTVPERPNEPIMPGKEGYIKGVFNSKGFPGVNHKTIFVDANTEGNTRHNLEFTIDVTPSAS